MEELSLHLIDIVENSKRAGARKIEIEVKVDTERDYLCIKVVDDGCGMSKEECEMAQSPFFTTKTNKKAGLGIPLLKQSTLMCDGSFELKSEKGKGTSIEACFRLSHIDRPPLGNLEDTVLTLFVGSSNYNIDFKLYVDEKGFFLSTEELKKHLGSIPFSSPDVIRFLKEYIHEGMEILKEKNIV